MQAKRLLAAVSALVLCTGVMGQVPGQMDRPVLTAAAEELIQDHLKYEVRTIHSEDSSTDHVIWITGYEDGLSAELVIPAEIDGLPVAEIGTGAFQYCTALTSVTIPDSVTRIGVSAFSNCTSLASVTIPDSVTRIENLAFSSCASLTSVMIPDSVTSIGTNAFLNCTSMTSVTIPDSVTEIGGRVFAGTPWLKAMQEKDPLVVVNGILIDGSTAMGDVSIPDNVTIITTESFRNTPITSVTLPDSLTSIESSAFHSCRNLTAVTIPDGVTSIGSSAFWSCENLAEITIPGSVTVIGSSAFNGCKSLTTVNFPDTVVTGSSFRVFEKTPWLAALREKDPLVIINGILVDGLAAEGDIVIPDGVTEVADLAFDHTSAYLDEETENKFPTSITIPGSVTRIGVGAIYTTSSLTSVTILNPDCEIDHQVYYYHTIGNRLEILTDGYGGTTLNRGSGFSGTIYGYSGSTAEAYAKKYDITFSALDAPTEQPADTKGLTYYKADDHIEITGYTEELPAILEIPAELEGLPVTTISGRAFEYCTGLTEVTIPATVTNIGMDAFHNCTDLAAVTFPDTMTSIGVNAFYGCTSLTAVTLPGTLTSLEDYAFCGCTALADVTFPQNVETVGSRAFKDTPWLAALVDKEALVIVSGVLLSGEKATGEVTIPDGVRSLAGGAFADNAAITAVTIPAGVMQIGREAFYCCENLASVTILEPDCTIYDARATICNSNQPSGTSPSDKPIAVYTGTICGYADSTAQAYAEKHSRTFSALDTDEPVIGDVSGDKEINASDAAIVLMAAATEGTTGVSTLTPAQKKAADVNKDTEVNASDAAIILMYSASVGTGYDGTIEDFQKK